MKKLNIKKYLPSIIFLIVTFTLTVAFFVLPKSDYSVNEKRVLAEFETPTFEELSNGELSVAVDNYFADHFPFRDLFVGINSYYNIANGTTGAGGFYHGKDGYLIAAPTNGTLENVKQNVIDFEQFAKENKLKADMIIVPTTGYIMSDKLPAVHKEYKDGQWLNEAKSVAGSMNFIDVLTPFKAAAKDTQLYYKTDHHLTSAGSFELYKTYAKAKGITPIENYRVEKVSGFYGTAYSSGGYWLTQPDDVELWHNDSLNVTVEIQGVNENTVSNSIFFKERLNEPDKYPVFFDGVHSYEKITNKDAKGGKLLLIKDSYAHCFVGFLAQHYSEIHMIDLRSYRGNLSKLITDNGLNEVLFLYGINNLAEMQQKRMMINFEN